MPRHSLTPRCWRKNRGGFCRSPVYTMNAKGEATCFYHARSEEIADVRARAALLCEHVPAETQHGSNVFRCNRCGAICAAIARARGEGGR